MIRYTIKDLVQLPHDESPISYKDQIAVINVKLHGRDTATQLFAVDAFVIGYTTQGDSNFEFNNTQYHLEPGKVFILAPTHTCRLMECSADFKIRLLLLDASTHNLSVHLNYLVKSERWIQTYFYPVLNLNEQESTIMNTCVDRIEEQINRPDFPNRAAIIRLAVTWHHVELDNIMQEHMNKITDNNKPLTRQQTLARQLYRLIINNYRKEHQVKFYSEQMCLTPQYLNQITTVVFGKSLSTIISGLLFSTAKSMVLSSDMSIQEIANELSFPDQASFSKFIKKHAGASPNALRKRNPHQDTI